MYAQVVVLTYQAPDIDSFTYKVPKELEEQIRIGQLIEVPFGKRSPMGIVVNLSGYPERSKGFNKKMLIKPLSRRLLERSLLLPYQVELLRWMARYYMAPMVNCLEAMLPDIPKQIQKETNVESLKTKAITEKNVSRSSLVFSQSLILVPTLNKIPETLAKFPKAKNPIVYHNELKAKERFEAWQKILSGNCDYIFGSRSAIFSPAPNLKEIIIYDEHDSAYKDIRSPYFDTLTIAEKISYLTKAEIKIVDPSPRITTYFNFKNHIKMQKFNNKVEIVSLEEERLAGNFSPISTRLANLMTKSKNTLLFLNKKKETGHVYCKNCHEKQFIEGQPQVCPNCKSADIYFNILNLESLASEAKNLFPKASVNMLDEKSGATAPEGQKQAIDVATAAIFYKPILRKYDLVCFVRPDSTLNEPDFSTGETVYSQTVNLMKLLYSSGRLVIQTYDTNNPTLNQVAKQNYSSFFESQTEERKPLSYPPYSLLVKLRLTGKNELILTREATKLINHLKLLTVNRELITFFGPYKPIFWQKQNTSNIIIKYKTADYSLESREKSQAQIAKLLLKSQKGLQIIVEPTSIN